MTKSFDVPCPLKYFHFILLVEFVSFMPFLIAQTRVLTMQRSMEMVDEVEVLDK